MRKKKTTQTDLNERVACSAGEDKYYTVFIKYPSEILGLVENDQNRKDEKTNLQKGV
jgi:hypothetical protein